jgi:hypothetical protein
VFFRKICLQGAMGHVISPGRTPAFCTSRRCRRPSRLASSAQGRIVDSMPEPRKVIRYTLDAALIFAPLSGMLYFLFDPAAFNAFLAWLVSVL